MSKQYKLLEKQEIDVELLKEVAEAHNELGDLQRRKSYLKNLLAEHEDMNKFLWKTANEQVIPIPLLSDDHLKNIMEHLRSLDRKIPFAIELEYQKRFGSELKTLAEVAGSPKAITEGEIAGDEGYDENDLPF